MPDPQLATFLFTDLENSTPLWEAYPQQMQILTSRHDEIIQQTVADHRGRIVKGTGDGFHAAFESAPDGLAAALAGQQAMLEESWPSETGQLKVRMGLHTGESQARGGDYYGAEVNRAARVMGIAHGGQILVSEATAALIRTALPDDVSLLDLGEHRLRGLAVPERVAQVCHPTLPQDFPPLKSLSTYKHNLPVQLSTFVGREKELADIQRLLGQTHLLTLLGPGGTGKTRLMLEVAEEVIDQFRDGVWFVELAALTDPDMIPDRVAAVLNVQQQPGRSMLETLAVYLRHKELLLLLDNVEHLIRDSAEFVEHLLMRCPGLKVLVTGREALFISGEITLQIPSLSLAKRDGEANLADIKASEGVQLFVARVRNIHPDFEITARNGPTIADIVRRLDGIPLALELAAARTRMLSVEQIAERLNDRFRLLTGGRRTALPRQQTLQALIDWSWKLLDEKERLLLRRLSVFSGGWSVSSAQAVVADEKLDEYDVFDNLEQLVNKSLVTVHYPASGRARYGMLESIRQYGLDHLFESGEGQDLRDRHAEYFVTFAQEAGPHLTQSTMLPWVEKIKLELDNLRAVLSWTLDEAPELALRICANLFDIETYWISPREAQTWLEQAIEATREHLQKEEPKIIIEDFIRALIGLGFAYGWQGNSAAMVEKCEEAVQLAREYNKIELVALATALKPASDPFAISPEAIPDFEEAVAIGREYKLDRVMVYGLGAMGMAYYRKGDIKTAIQYLEETIQFVRKIDNPRLNAAMFAVFAIMAQIQGDLEQAKRYWLVSYENYKPFGDQRGILLSRSAYAHILRFEGDYIGAESIYRQTILGWQDFGQPVAVAHQLECFAFIAITRGNFERAAKLIGAARKIRDELNNQSKDPQEIADMNQAMEQLSAELGEEALNRLLAQGRLVDLDDAIQMALNDQP